MMELLLTQEWQSELHLLGQKILDPNFAQPGLSFSIKTTWRSYVNKEEPVLLFSQVDWSSGSLPGANEWTVFRLNSLRELIAADFITPSCINAALSTCMLQGEKYRISPLVLLHAAASGVVTCFTQPLALLTRFCDSDGGENLRVKVGNRAQIYPFMSNLHKFSQLIAAEAGGQKNLILMNRGLLVTSDSGDNCIHEYEQIVQRIEQQIQKPSEDSISRNFPLNPGEVLPGLRKDLSKKAGYPLILHLEQSKQIACLMEHLDRWQADLQAVWLPDFAARCGLITERDIAQEGEMPKSMKTPSWGEFRPCYGISPGIGLIAVGRSVPESQYTGKVALTQIAALQLSEHNGGQQGLGEAEFQDYLQWHGLSNLAQLCFSGEIALVTGAASGIGKACAAALLARGAAVVGVDINPSIEQVFEHPNYYGLVCDLADEAQVQSAVQETVRRFGGLDMLILNAGLFPSGCHIKSIALDDYMRVINVNLTANLVLLREAYPLLKNAPLYGRVVIVGSKNLKAPGPGAVAYSTSKAALTQMARVAAMEWAQDGIRVNVIHPDSVFDTGLYTEEVLQARAAHYGVTVEQYKKRNLLKTEITSHDVGEMVAEMCGSIFRSITGAQIQMDGGNERTI
jgi:NAD(P)-dependent dehydrogenase (short-subunit alcohol dehydrogenase family)/rhamnose utilization protein RhaD (predicted bifunctional aldolase and dehydrogenase)